MKNSYFTAASMLALSFASVPFLAQAQTPAAEEVTEVVVTLQKREQKILNVPAAVTSISGAFMTDLGITDFAELALFVPGLEVQDQSPNNPGFVIRGITSDSGAATGEPRVSVYQDGVSIARSRGSYVELFDVERVEVAKGPQSTLFGRSALIGAVNIVQAKAKPTFDASGALSLGSYNYEFAEAMVNLPLNDKFAVRLAGRLKERDGYVENLLGGDDFNGLGTYAARLSLLWTPTEKLRFDLIVNTQNDNTPGTSFKSGTFNPTNPTTGAVIGTTSPYTGAALSSASGFMSGRGLGLERSVSGVTLLSKYKLSDAYTLSSVTAYREFFSSEVFDPDGFSLPLFVFAEDAHGDQWSQELRLNYDKGGAVTWFAGASYFKEIGSQAVPLQIDERVAALLLGNGLTRPTPQSIPTVQATMPFIFGPAASLIKTAHRETFTNFGETESWDIFGDVTWRALPKLELSAGLRYTTDNKKSGFASSVDNGGSVLAALSASLPVGTPVGLFAQPTAGNGSKTFKSLEDDGLTYRLIGRYLFSDNINAYASVARGRQPKTLSTTSPATPFGAVRFTEADAETADSLELGLKTRFFDGRLSWDSALYTYKYENFQVSVPNGSGGFVTVSAGEADADGFETQVSYRPIKSLDLFATYAYNKARFGNGLFEGNSFRLSPDNTLSLGGKLKVATTAGVFSITPTYTWQSEVFFDDNNDRAQFQPAVAGLRPVADSLQDEKQDSYGLLNLRLGFSPNKGKWTFELFGDNLLDEDYIKDAGNTGDTFGIPTFIKGEPMMYGATLRFKY